MLIEWLQVMSGHDWDKVFNISSAITLGINWSKNHS